MLHHLPQHPGGAAVGLAELEQRREPLVALAGEHRQQQEHRPAEGDRRGLDRRGERDAEPERREQGVDEVDPDALAELLAERGPAVERLAGARGERVDQQLGRERRDQHPRADRVRGRAAGEHEHHRRPERKPGVAERVQQARRAARPLGDVDRAPDQQGSGDHQRHDRRREHEQRRDERDLGRHRVAGADLEDHPRGDRETDQHEHELAGVDALRTGGEDGERDRGDRERAADDELVAKLASGEGARRARLRRGEQPLYLRGLLRGGPQPHGASLLLHRRLGARALAGLSAAAAGASAGA